jgi:hypothetical protein
MWIFAKCLEPWGFHAHSKKIKKFDFTAKTFGRRWGSNLHVHSQNCEHYHSAMVTPVYTRIVYILFPKNT